MTTGRHEGEASGWAASATTWTRISAAGGEQARDAFFEVLILADERHDDGDHAGAALILRQQAESGAYAGDVAIRSHEYAAGLVSDTTIDPAAVGYLKIVADFGDDDGAAWAGLLLGTARKAAGDTDGALAAFQAASDRGDGAHAAFAAFGAFRLLDERGEAAAARALLERAAIGDHDIAVSSKTLLGVIQRDRDGDIARAVATLREAAAGGDPNANLTLGQTLESAGDPRGAAEAFHKVVATQNAAAPAAMLSLSGIALDEDDKDTARHWLTRLVDTNDPALWPVAANSLGLLAKERRDAPDALRWFGRLIDAGHADAVLAAAHLGELQYLLGDTADAVRWYEYTLAHTDDPALVGEAAYRAGEIHSQAGAYDRARPLLARAVDSGYSPFAADAAALLART